MVGNVEPNKRGSTGDTDPQERGDAGDTGTQGRGVRGNQDTAPLGCTGHWKPGTKPGRGGAPVTRTTGNTCSKGHFPKAGTEEGTGK